MLDISGTIATGGVAQDLIPTGQTPTAWFLQNIESGTDLYVRDDGTAASAAAGSIRIPPGALYETPIGYVVQGMPRVSVFSVLTGHKFTARRY